MQSDPPIVGDLVLIGGGHAQVALLKSLAMKPVPGLRTTLICREIDTPYSGMLPGFVEGVWSAQDIHVDLSRLASMAGARLINAPVAAIHADDKRIEITGRPCLPYDVLTVNTGGEPNLAAIAGAASHCIPVKPIGLFLRKLAMLTEAGFPKRLAIIGGGAAGCELALALSARWQRDAGRRPEIRVFGRAARLVPEHPQRAARLLHQAMTKAGCSIHCAADVTRVDDGRLFLENGDSYEFDACFLVSSVAPPSWLSSSGLTLDEAGFIAVTASLQSVSHPEVFAAGDVATITTDPRPKAGVYAVRAGPVLAQNIRRFIAGQRTRSWRPQTRALAILGTADGGAIAIRGSHASRSRLWWWLKKRIDRRWIAKYTELSMPPPTTANRLTGINGRTKPAELKDPAFEPMRCLGCGAKTGHETLVAAMREATAAAIALGANAALMPPDGLTEDSAVLATPQSGEMVQSIDVISELVSDPFILGRIAAVHAMSDIYAAGAVPVWAMASVTLAAARADLQQSQLTQLMTGGLMALSEAGARLIGGHTGESQALNIGYAVTGWREVPPELPNLQDDIRLILTKPLGSGVIMAAHMQLAARGEWVAGATRYMAEGNGRAAEIMAPYRPMMTDVTGFGLARHALNLAERCGAGGVEISMPAVPLMAGAQSCLQDGHRSSLHEMNQASVRMINEATSPTQAAILFDPQTSGGLLAALPAGVAEKVCAALADQGTPANIIGRLQPGQSGLTLLA